MKYATFIVSLLILVAVLIPGPDLPDVSIGGFDKIIHMGMFGVWAVAVRYDFDRKPFRFFLVFAVGVFFSLTTEILQLLVEGRTFDVYDITADVAGLAIGLLVSGELVRILKRWQNRTKQ